VHVDFWWGKFKERENLRDLGVDGRIILNRSLQIGRGWAWTGLIWLGIRTSGDLL